MPQSDFEVIQWILGGETAAFEVLLRQHQQDTCRLTFRMTRNAVDAKGLAQETLVQSYRALGTFRGQSRFSPWLDRIAMNLCRNHLKATAREAPAEVDGQQPDLRVNSLGLLLTDERGEP